jgi:segregation and condensation protein B
MKLTEIEAAIESILFISGEAVTLSKIAYAIEQDLKTTKSIIGNLIQKYESEKRGLQIIEINNSYQMCTNPQYFDYIRKLYVSSQKQVLSQTLLETLAIIAYKQPITKMQIEEIRGVSAEHAVNKLLERKLICEVGRMDMPGKPILFGTSEEFLRYFGFKSLDKLPKIEDIEI